MFAFVSVVIEFFQMLKRLFTHTTSFNRHVITSGASGNVFREIMILHESIAAAITLKYRSSDEAHDVTGEFWFRRERHSAAAPTEGWRSWCPT